ncbi:hypothetical protein Taro_051485, partial [Colocasia esculenta]|nr:hypothetical protein [Colocasia esculenta]
VGIGLKKHKGNKNREESSLCRQKDFWKALGGSLVVGWPIRRVFIAQSVQKYPWGSWAHDPRSIHQIPRVPRVQIVDTLSRPVDRVLWELGLVSTLLDLVSTPLDHFFIFCLRAWSIVSTPV